MAKCAACAKKPMRHRVTIQAEKPGVDAGGGQTDPWASPTVVATVSAAIEPLSGREVVHSMQLQDSVTHRVTIRYRAGVTAKHRLVFNSRLFNIRAVINPEEANRFLEIMAQEGVAV